MRFYVGTYTRHGGPGICEVRWDGARAAVRVVAETPDPSFLALHPAGHTLYAVNEQAEGTVSAFTLDPATGDLQPLGTDPTGGAAPCHLAVHPSGKWLAVANYRGASIAIFGIKPDGALGQRTDLTPHRGHGVHPVRQRQPHPHGVYWQAHGKQLWVPDLGTDSIILHSFDPGTGALGSPTTRVSLPPGCGPRHLAFHATANTAYCLNELDSSLVALTADPVGGIWRPQQRQSTLPAGFAGKSTAAEIALHPSERWLYCSNRGHDSVAFFDLRTDPFQPRLVGHIPSGGQGPRHFALNDSGQVLAIANQQGNNVAVHTSDHASAGRFVHCGSILIPGPACVITAQNPTVTS